MKASSSREKSEPIFQPFDLTLRIESLKDAQDIRFLFNCSPVTEALNVSDDDSRAVRQAIDEQTGYTAAGQGFHARLAALKKAVRES